MRFSFLPQQADTVKQFLLSSGISEVEYKQLNRLKMLLRLLKHFDDFGLLNLFFAESD